MKILGLTALVAAGLLAGGGLIWRHFNQPLDWPTMENPNATMNPPNFEPVEEPLDGDHTYVDNPALFAVLEGSWESADGRWVLTMTGDAFDTQMSLSLDREKAAECGLSYTYLLPDPSPNRWTELRLEEKQLTDGSGTDFGIVDSLYHEGNTEEEGSGTLHLTVHLADRSEEEITLTQTS